MSHHARPPREDAACGATQPSMERPSHSRLDVILGEVRQPDGSEPFAEAGRRRRVAAGSALYVTVEYLHAGRLVATGVLMLWAS